MASGIEKALSDLRKGKFVMVYDADGREEETDFVIPSHTVKPVHIRTMRKDGGGLICMTVHPLTAKKLGLPRMVDLFDEARPRYQFFNSLVPQNLPYDCRSSFSLTINSRANYTGITDIDRSTTVRDFAKLAKDIVPRKVSVEEAATQFWHRFRSPGHVHLLIASDRLLAERQGHTELATSLALMAKTIPTAAICEMMGNDGRALSKAKAKAYSRRKGFQFLEGREIMEAWERWSA